MTCSPDWPEIKEAAHIVCDDDEFIVEQSTQDISLLELRNKNFMK